MSSLINKVKEALHSDKDETHNTTHNTTGTHTTGTHTAGTQGTHTTGTHTTGTHSGQPEGISGPHSSRVANAADPRVDSDRDGSRTAGGNTYGTSGTHTGTHTGTTGTHTGTHPTNFTSGSGNNTSGPHQSDALNKLDPRVDSDRDGSRTAGGNNYGTSGTHTTGTHTGTGIGSTGTHTGTGIGSTGTHTGTGYSSGAPEGTHGPHSSRVANAADPRVDSDRDGSRTAGGNNYGTSGTHTGTGSNFGTTGTHGTSGAPEGTYGPHGSRVANAADPRVDSDRDGSKVTGATGIAYPVGGQSTHGTHGTHGTTGTHGTSGSTEGSHGPHNSRIANALDPRVDSDRDGSRTAGGNNYGTSGTHGTGNNFGTTGTHTGTGAYGSSGAPEGTHGPHGSRVANAADPRVDSDRDGSRTAGGNNYGTGNNFGTTGTHGTGNNFGTTGTHTGTGAYGSSEGTHGPHGSRVANAADPRVDSDRDGSRTAGGNNYGTSGTHGTGNTAFGSTGTHGTTGTHTGSHPGPAPNTAGPHKSDALNKLDPRVDSDRDGSKTVGQDKTYDQQHPSYAGKDPHDAAQVPPSVMQKAIGQPVVAHDKPEHGHRERHSVSHQEDHRGL